MSSRFMRVAALATVAMLASELAGAQASAPVTREQRKAETAKMNQEGKLAPAGGSLKEPAHGKPSTKTRADRAKEIEEARKKGEMVPAGGGSPK